MVVDREAIRFHYWDKRGGKEGETIEGELWTGRKKIDVTGFSRGTVLALDIVIRIHDEGVDGENPEIRFLSIWDTVASFGLPVNNVNLGYKLTVPDNVQTCRHAISLDECRFTFPLT